MTTLYSCLRKPSALLSLFASIYLILFDCRPTILIKLLSCLGKCCKHDVSSLEVGVLRLFCTGLRSMQCMKEVPVCRC